MLTDWKQIRRRIPKAASDRAELASLFSDVLGESDAWVNAYRDWLARWHLTSDDDFRRTDNIDAFLRDSVVATPHDPEAAAVLQSLRKEFIVKPINGVGRTGNEALGEIRQAMREYRIQRAEAARHRGSSFDESYRDGYAASAQSAVVELCRLVEALSVRLGLEADCFCGHKIKESGRRGAAFESGYRFDLKVLKELGRLIEGVPQIQEQQNDRNADGSDSV